ncbi:MAG: AAA family ATPase [Magnetococcales bacterium]|nr:AAA family ATPase [Magnetococcales bacterium]
MTTGAEIVANRGTHTILGAEITGGFMEGARLEFTQGLNCIIGGRGTGKTTILEFVRYVLGLMPDPRRGGKSRAHAVVQSNLANGRVRLRFRTSHGMCYTAERPWNDDCQVLDEHGAATAISLDRDRIFRADVYSQNEIEQIATDTGFQMKLIDQFEEERIRAVNGEIGRILRDIQHSAGELAEMTRQMEDLAETASEGPAIEEKLKGFQQQNSGPDAKLIEQAHGHKALRDREQRAVAGLVAEFNSLGGKFQNHMEAMLHRLSGYLGADIAAGPNHELFQGVGDKVREFQEEFGKAIPWVHEHCQKTLGALSALAQDLELRHAGQEQIYRELMTKSQEEQSRISERVALQKRYLVVCDAWRNLEEMKQKYVDKYRMHQEMTFRLSGLRDDRFRLRKAIADHLTQALHPTIRVTVTQAGNRQAFAELLADGLKGSGLKYASLVDKIVQNLSPEELAICVQRKDANRLAELAGMEISRAGTVIERLGVPQTISKLETVEMDDLPRIELLDGRDYKEAGALSTGQRCTTILPILLLESERPLLIDQPEDNLDNAFIFETIVKSVKAAKVHRQLIFVTHNPNIPVLGEADRVFVLSSDGRRGTIVQHGTVDDVKERIETILEGGREAFLQRKVRYGH